MDGGVTIDSKEFSNSPGSSFVIGTFLTGLLAMLRASPIPNWIGNWIVVICGTVAQMLVSGLGVMSMMQGFITGTSVVGVYKSVTETTHAGRDKVPGTGDTEHVRKDKKKVP